MILVREVKSYNKVEEFVREAFETFNPKFENEVIVKPNFLKFDDPMKGCITHPDVVKAVVEILKENGHEVVIAEGGFYRESSDECFREFKLTEIAKCININRQ